jgi:hypothetical protein
MATETLTREEICRRGQAVIDALPAEAMAEFGGRMVAVDAASGDYEIGDHRVFAAARRLRQRRPHAIVYWGRVGASAAYRVGGSRKRNEE